MAGLSFTLSILKRNHANHNYANMNKRGFASVRTNRTKQCRNKSQPSSVPSSPSELLEKVKDMLAGKGNKSGRANNDIIHTSSQADLSQSQSVNAIGGTMTPINTHSLLDSVTEMAESLTREERKQALRDSIAKMKAQLAEEEEDEEM